MILQYITWDLEPQIIDFGSFELRYYSLMFGLGFILGYYILARFFRREGISIELLDKLTFYVIIATIIGARFGHCLFYEPEEYLTNPLKIILPFTGKIGVDFRFTGYQGLASHGGAIGILIGLGLFSMKYKQPFLGLLDKISVVTALAACFIRLGNLFNSEIYGVATDLPWGVKFMRESLYGVPVEEIVPKHPTQIYESIAYLLIFIVLILLYNKKSSALKQGFILGLFLISTFVSRFLIEFVKEDQVNFEEGMFLNMGQWLSIPFIIFGIYLLIRKPKQTITE